jgi:hypothetical protein
MKRSKLNIQVLIFLVFLFTACTEDILDKTPLDRYTGPVVFSDINLADAYLMDCYYGVRHGFKERPLSGFTDECWFIYPVGADLYRKGLLTSDNIGPFGRSDANMINWTLFSVIQKLNVFLVNIDNIPDSYEEEVEILKGEAKFLRAFAYSQMCMTYGGLPIMKEPNELGDDYSNLTRATFKETVDFIVSELDEASKFLKLKSEMQMGRATREAALAIKSRILIFAASDLTADGTADNELVGYQNPDRNVLWKAAKNAAKAVIDLGTCELDDFGAPDQEAVAENYYEFFRAYDLSSKEVIWGRMFNPDFAGELQKANTWYGSNGDGCWGSMNPTQNFVDNYEMKDGSKFFNHFRIDEKGYYQNTSTKFTDESIYHNREPRFYGTVLHDSALWRPRILSPELKMRDPLGIYSRRTFRYIENGDTTDVFGIDTRQGYTWWNGSYTGYVYKKFQDHEIDGTYGEMYNVGNKNIWIEVRYAEVILNYAEACLELGETSEATTYINMIRSRAALPNFTNDITEALRYERLIELAFENRRWFDIRRWKILEVATEDATGVEIIETHEGASKTTTWQKFTVFELGPFNENMYWVPIQMNEINSAPWLVQNPGY